jgi:hypothetical protein
MRFFYIQIIKIQLITFLYHLRNTSFNKHFNAFKKITLMYVNSNL